MTVLFLYLYYLYCLSIFQRTCRFRFKSGCKGKGFIFNRQTFSEVFLVFLSVPFSLTLYAKGKGTRERITLAVFLCESDRKDKNFIHYTPNFFGSFSFLFLGASALFTVSHLFKAILSRKAGAKVGAFRLQNKYIPLFFQLFLRGFAKALTQNDVAEHIF